MSDNNPGIFSCRNICWIVGALVGLVAMLIIWKSSVFWALVVGIALAIALALVLMRLFCGRAGELGMHHVHVAGTAAVTTGAGASAALDHDEDAKAAADAAASAMMGDEEAASGIAAEGGRYTPAAALDAAAVAEDEPAHTHAQGQPKPVSTPDYDGDGKLEGAGEGKRPEALAAARGGKADDLKLIKGVGPKLEQLCNSLGFYHWDQIANWTADEVAWVDANLKGFKGRVSRDNWVEQAKVLAAGGTTEFAQRAEKSGMYDKN